MQDFPLQNFYRMSLSNSDADDDNLQSTLFTSLPRQHTLTIRPDVPEAWNVQAVEAAQDIDNLICPQIPCGDVSGSDITSVVYSLKTLLIAGQCFEMDRIGRMMPPAGLQLVLQPESANRHHSGPASSASTWSSDTLVMNNLGYFQLHANPGLWRLTLAAGRAASIYSIDNGLKSDEETEITTDVAASDMNIVHSSTAGGSLPIIVRSFADSIKQLLVSKRPGLEHVALLDDAEAGVFDPPAVAEADKIHVFSLATGHMYERLLRIMMLSVVKRSSLPVKFWLFENYLSPSFKSSAAEMAATYGFEVGYVTYKWPAWLTQQTEKQRIIWGYKILFLDVLFPLNVKRVIYVDSDQVVRADLKELWEMDLHGKPYAYVPFCSSRKETLGYQFWRQGFWENHLQGLPYHISALYVVDLQLFRRHAVGDILRSTYDNLARDPNSLANLDQDLPNFAQHSVPIHSLPQEWLWCETWCSDESKAGAKTIDLCNNPLHKEPKLDMARRVIDGPLFKESWVQLDSEIRDLLTSRHSNSSAPVASSSP